MRGIRNGLFNSVELDPNTGCWNWTHGVDGFGYGQTKFMGRKIGVHRLAAHLFLSFDLSDRKIFVLHKCDNPKCFNPKHLFTGTSRDNVNDCIAKGRFKNPPPKRARERHFCPLGHAYSEENTVLRTEHGKTYRKCRTCKRKEDRMAQRRHRARLSGSSANGS